MEGEDRKLRLQQWEWMIGQTDGTVHSLIETQESPGIFLRWLSIGREIEGT